MSNKLIIEILLLCLIMCCNAWMDSKCRMKANVEGNVGGNRTSDIRGKKIGRRWMQIMHLPSAIKNQKDFLTLQKAMDKTLSTAFYARITTGKRAIKQAAAYTSASRLLLCFPMKSQKRIRYAVLCTMFHRYELYRALFLPRLI